MGCTPTTLRRRRRQIGLREEVPDLPFSNAEVDPWFIPGSFVQHDMSAFISPTPVALMPSENPPPYSEELQEGHITLMRGTTASKDESNAVETSILNVGEATVWNTSLVTTGDVSILNNTYPTTSSVDNAAVEELANPDELQYRRGSCISNTENTTFVDAAESESTVQGSGVVDTSSIINPPDHEEVVNITSRHPVAILPAPIQFRRHLHRSLSAGNSNLLMDEHLRVPNPRAASMQTMTHPEPLDTPVPPKVTLPPITRAPRNISPILRESWAPKEPFGRRPSRLPPLHRKRNRVSTWHGENIVPSSTINTVQE